MYVREWLWTGNGFSIQMSWFFFTGETVNLQGILGKVGHYLFKEKGLKRWTIHCSKCLVGAGGQLVGWFEMIEQEQDGNWTASHGKPCNRLVTAADDSTKYHSFQLRMGNQGCNSQFCSNLTITVRTQDGGPRIQADKLKWFIKVFYKGSPPRTKWLKPL